MIPQRLARVAELIKRQISSIIQQDLQDPHLGFITVTKVTVTRDLKQADIWISIMGDAAAQKASVDTLSRAQKHIRELLAGRVELRYIPALRFRLDKSIEYSSHIAEIISRLKKEEGWDNQ